MGVCAHTSVCVSSQSLFETSIVKPTLERVCLCVQQMCVLLLQTSGQAVCVLRDTGHVSLLVIL